MPALICFFPGRLLYAQAVPYPGECMDFSLKRKSLDAPGGTLVCGLWEGRPLSGLERRVDQALSGVVSRMRKSGILSAEYGAMNDALYTDGALPAEKVLFIGLGKELDRGKTRKLGKELGGHLAAKGIQEASVSAFEHGDECAEMLSLGMLLGAYLPDEEKSERATSLERVSLLYSGAKPSAGLLRGTAIGNAVNYARFLNNAGSNIVTPFYLAQEARKLQGIEVEILDRAALEAEHFGSLLAVARGSSREPYVAVMRYHGNPDADTVALLGKGVTFDTGGVNQKPSAGLEEMRMDMSGAGNVLAAMRAVAELKPAVNVVGIFGAVENKDSASGYHPGDVLRSRSGKTIEVMDTDAEGRNVLADLIDKALEYSPDEMVDMATLTGACMVALGKGDDAPAGLFTNESGKRLAMRLSAAASSSGERLWPLPSGEFYQRQLASERADLRHLGDRFGGASSAAQFLFNFSGDVPHCHIDIAGTAIAKNATGWGVQLLLEYLLAR